MRLDKYLSHLQFGSRQVVRNLIKAGRVTVAGTVCRDPGQHVSETATVRVDDQVVGGQLGVTYLLNKPAGVITATTDPHQRTVMGLIAPADRRPGLFPVGRLDKDTTGLLLLTTDGAMGHALLSPAHHVPKTYFATLSVPLTPAMIASLTTGVVLKDFTTQPALVRVVQADPPIAALTITEGKFHQVKRMFHAVGTEVVALQRESFGPLHLPADLAPGDYRLLTPAELASIQPDR